jgi:N-acyl homoserine lactone hydrolase
MNATDSVSIKVFRCGTLKSHKHLFTAGRGLGEPFEVPVPFFLIEHPKGKVLFDTGNALEVARDKVAHWGEGVMKAYDPQMTEDDFAANQLSRIGIRPEEITHVVLSHLHLDHAGAVGAFPKATYVAQRAELQYAYVPDFFQKSAYIRADFDKPHLDWRLLEGERDDGWDLFGDGALRIVHTPGHTPGHQSLLVELPGTEPWLLTGDSVYTEEILEEDILPGLVWSPSESVRSIARMRHLRETKGVRVITGHDPDAFARLHLAPASYPDCERL